MAPAQLCGTQTCGLTMTVSPRARASRIAARNSASGMSLPRVMSALVGLPCQRNGMTAMARAPIRFACASARRAPALPNGCPAATTTLRPSRRFAREETGMSASRAVTQAARTAPRLIGRDPREHPIDRMLDLHRRRAARDVAVDRLLERRGLETDAGEAVQAARADERLGDVLEAGQHRAPVRLRQLGAEGAERHVRVVEPPQV